MPATRYVLGCAAVAAFSTVVGLGTVVIVRGAVSGGSVQSLSQAQVAAQLSAAGADESHDAQSSPHPSASPSPHSPSKHPSTHAVTSQTGTDSGEKSSSAPSGQSHSDPANTGTAQQSEPARTTSSGSHPHASADQSSSRPKPTPTPTATPTPTPTPTDAAVTKVLSSVGGSVVARCSGASESATVYLVSWSPAQGYSVDEVRRGPAQEAEITFTTKGKQVNVTIHCSASGPVEEVEIETGDG